MEVRIEKRDRVKIRETYPGQMFQRFVIVTGLKEGPLAVVLY